MTPIRRWLPLRIQETHAVWQAMQLRIMFLVEV
jgi:hypothetical protein